MTHSELQRQCRQADKEFDAARKKLSRTAKRLFPIGTIVDVSLGRAIVRGRVIGHGHDWSTPEEVHIENIRTGKRRTFSITYSGNYPTIPPKS